MLEYYQENVPIMTPGSDSTHRGYPPKMKPSAIIAYKNGKLVSTEATRWCHMQQRYGKTSSSIAN